MRSAQTSHMGTSAQEAADQEALGPEAQSGTAEGSSTLDDALWRLLLENGFELAGPVAQIEELELAVKWKEASFAQAFLALYLATHPLLGEYAGRLRALCEPLIDAFEETHGRIEESQYGHYAAAGAVLTRFGSQEYSRLPLARDIEMFVWWESLTWDTREANALFSEIMRLRDRVTMFLSSSSSRPTLIARDIALRQLYGISSELIQALDEEAARTLPDKQWKTKLPWKRAGQKERWRALAQEHRPSEPHLQTIAGLRKRVDETTTVYLESARRVAQRKYVDWMLAGLGIVLLPLSILGIFTGLYDLNVAWVATAAAGAVGAVISVLQRMGKGPLDLNPESDKRSFWQLGLARPVIGATLGVVSYVLVGGGLIAITPPRSATNQALYFAGIAFLAGFSERFAQDMLIGPSGLAKQAGSAAKK